jgi:hypothetical protein
MPWHGVLTAAALWPKFKGVLFLSSAIVREVFMPELNSDQEPESTDALALNRRARVRHVISQPALCQTSTAQGDDFWLLGKIKDLSTRGARLWLQKPFQIGAILAIEPTQALDRLVQAPQARVVYCKRAEKGGWAIGCEFTTPLTVAELQSLL